ncbi:MAG: class I SAM-dependent methyltransferase [Planctomycetaceae bacterium]|nr:class I SAM-dependent methyltransferase [Planctomycetaceae bacterium]
MDNLEIMELAERYNAALAARIVGVLGNNQDVVLDHGAGTGTFAKRISAHGYCVECLEPDERMAASIRQMGFTCGSSPSVYSSGSFTGVYSLNVLEHIEDDVAELYELHRLLRPHGKLVLFVPAFRVLYSSMDRKVGHLRRYTRGALRAKVERAGFRVLSCSYFDSIGFFASLAYRFWGNRRGDLDPRTIAFYDRWIFPVSLCGDRFLRRVLGKNVFLVAQHSVGD